MKWTGRPPRFQDPEELENAIADYFYYCDSEHKPYTVTGLALSLGTSVTRLRDYRDCLEDVNILKQLDDDEKQRLSVIVKRAYQICENYVEENLLDPNCTKSPVGYIFAAKNFGWVDKQEIEQTTKEIHVTLEDDEN